MSSKCAIVLLDGGLGTSLEDKYGIHFSSSTPLWSSHLLLSPADRDTLVACQRDFVRAGVDLLLTATYQVSLEGFARTKTTEWPNGVPAAAVGRYLDGALKVAEEAVADAGKVRIALGLGPYGACLVPSQEYSGQYDPAHDGEEELAVWHEGRLRLFETIQGLGDRIAFVAFETVPRRDEIIAVRKAFAGSGLKETPFWISCVFPGEGETLPDGTGVEQAVEAMLSSEISEAIPHGIGINCTKVGKLTSLVEQYERAVARLLDRGWVSAFPSLVIYPDGTNGEVYNSTTQQWELPEGSKALKVGSSAFIPLSFSSHFLSVPISNDYFKL